MEIKVGGRYKRVKAAKLSQTVFLGQEIIVTEVTPEGSAYYRKKLKDGRWSNRCHQPLEIFKQNFKPFNMQMRNK